MAICFVSFSARTTSRLNEDRTDSHLKATGDCVP